MQEIENKELKKGNNELEKELDKIRIQNQIMMNDFLRFKQQFQDQAANGKDNEAGKSESDQ